uniref:Mutant cytolysin A n=1 Tax=Escherichia coli TaxID=562 RepID=Q68S87_ECOLX|nr:mutant cytolysin A [Escherichia coli]
MTEIVADKTVEVVKTQSKPQMEH